MPRNGKPWAIAALVVLVAVNVVLIALLLRPRTPAVATDVVAADASSVEGDSAEGGSAEAPAVEEQPTPEPVEPEPVAGVAVSRLIAAASDAVAWRAVVGACDSPASVERTEDRGATWSPVDPGLAPLVRLKANSPQQVFAIGGRTDCAPSFAFSRNGGDSWSAADGELRGSWYLAPADRGTVHGPNGEVPAPCAVVDLAGLDNSRAAIACTDGAVFGTGDGGATWNLLNTRAGVVAIAPAGDRYLLGAIEPECPGVAVVAMAPDGAGLDGPALSCAVVDAAVPGEVALAAAGPAVWLWAGEQTLVSTDGGSTW